MKSPTADDVAKQANQTQGQTSVQYSDGRERDRGRLTDDFERIRTDVPAYRKLQDLRRPVGHLPELLESNLLGV